MTDPSAYSLIQRLADELDHYKRLLMYDRREIHPLSVEARAYLAKTNDQSDEALVSIRKKTPRYQMSIIISTFDSCIDNRMGIIRLGLNPDAEILESVSLPKKLAPFALATDELNG